MTRTLLSPARRPERGFAIVSAIFLLVVLTALGAFMLTFSTSQQITSAQDLQGSRALAAARGGMQWAAARLNGAANCAPATASFVLDGFTVDIACAMNTYSEGVDTRRIFRVTVTASGGGAVGGLGFVERQVSSFVEF